MSAPDLPAPRTPGRYSVALVCLGNICRSPMADVVLSERVDEAGLSGRVTVASCGTGDWHVGHPMDERAAATLTAAGYDASRHRAQQWAQTWLEEHDLVLAMDESNLADLGGRSERVRLFRDFDPVGTGGEVPDPYYGGDDGFEEVLTMVERTSAAIVDAFRRLEEP
ncbi:low molecular weight protein-tyrosine-phosphatase [Nocardioides dongkuii]|uniref:low molecular weight protein-tyrosine-phosphatase n=1 Tax=Nocardioides dongkuii TaxID=2760089 RepID=UPI0015FE0CFB|nr:low molecular weight protein-tyrosine-phosphatase [Nocardioides dongkuii]